MEIKKYIKRLLSNTCIFFTVSILLYMLTVVFVNVDDSKIRLDAERIFLFLVFSFLIALANGILKIGAISAYLRRALHFAICGIALYLCLLLPINPTASYIIIGISLYTVFYFAGLGIISFYRSRYKKESEKSKEYTKHFSK